MGRYVRFALIIVGMVLASGFAFAVYAHFLVDYSLENLEFTIQATQRQFSQERPANQRLYQSMIQDLVIEEASRENADFKNLTLLELASRSLGGYVEKDDLQAANLYLSKAAESKIAKRSQLLRVIDLFYKLSLKLARIVQSLGNYFYDLFAKKGKKDSVELSSVLILSQADEKERQGFLDEAADLYKKFIANYPNHPDRPFVIISLAHLLIKQQKLAEAERILLEVQTRYVGLEVAQFARTLLRKIDLFEQKKENIRQLKKLIQSSANKEKRERMKFQLALEYLYSYSVPEAQEIFKELEEASDDAIRRKAKFYLAWIYKTHAQFDEGAQVLMDLIEKEKPDENSQAPITAQLADIYYMQGKMKEARSAYKNLITGDGKGFLESAVAKEALRALQDYGSAESGARDLAFEELRQGRLDNALRLFEKYLYRHPNDADSYAAIASIRLLLGDLRQAYEHAQKANRLSQKGAYPPAVLAYVYGFLRDNNQAIRFYQEALNRNGLYSASLYNLGYTYLQKGDAGKAFAAVGKIDFSSQDMTNKLRSKTLNNAGYALWYLGSYDQARQRFQEALQIDPDFEDASKNLKRIGGEHSSSPAGDKNAAAKTTPGE